MNYYHESMGYLVRTEREVRLDLARLAPLTRKLKIYHNPWGNSIAHARSICRIAKGEGFHVVWNENNDTTTFTEANWPDWCTAVVADAATAQAAGADEFLVGNEMSIHHDGSALFADDAFPGHVQVLAAAAAARFTGPIGVQEGWWKHEVWTAAGLGSMSRLYLTLYEDDAGFARNARNCRQAVGGRCAVGEFSTGGTLAAWAGGDEGRWARQLAERMRTLEQIGCPDFYYFTFRDTDNGFGMLTAGNDAAFHRAWYALFGERR